MADTSDPYRHMAQQRRLVRLQQRRTDIRAACGDLTAKEARDEMERFRQAVLDMDGDSLQALELELSVK